MNLTDTVLDLSLRKIIRRGRALLGQGNPWLQASLGVSELIGAEVAKSIAAMPRRQPGSVEFAGMKIGFNDNVALLGMLDEIFVRKNYEFHSSNDEPVVIDCGANIGVGVAYIKSLFPRATVHAFEPDKAAFECLQANVAQNDFRQVHLHNKAVWTKSETLSFFPDGSWGGGLLGGPDVPSIQVEAVDLNDFLDKPVDLLKIDIEGAEGRVIDHTLARIGANVTRVFFEWHSMKGEPQALGRLLDGLASHGFRYHIKEAAARQTPFTNVPAGAMDAQLDVFAYKGL